MEIQIISAIGAGKTSLASFDCALQNAGVSNYNLIPLSSVIPPNSKISPIQKYTTPEEDFGKRLYVVKAEHRSDEVGQCIGAGIGWYQLDDGRGFFVEHEAEGGEENLVKKELEDLITGTLEDMCGFRNIAFEPERLHSLCAVKKSTQKYECALVLAVYQSQNWI